MKPHFKSNNFVALLIAVILIAIGFALAFIHKQSESNEENTNTPVTSITKTVPEKDAFSA
jgi:cell division protein FtsN